MERTYKVQASDVLTLFGVPSDCRKRAVFYLAQLITPSRKQRAVGRLPGVTVYSIDESAPDTPQKASAEMLEVRLLGKFEVRVDGKQVKLTSRSAQTLLAYLVLNPGIDHLREKLAGILWPESSEVTARSNLRQALWRVNRELGSRTLRVDKLTVRLPRSRELWSDVYELGALRPDLSTADLMRIVSAYEGELLPGFYTDWVTLERERAAAQLDRGYSALLEGLERQGRWTEIVEWAERWIGHGRAPEASYRALMVAYGNLSEAGKIREAFARCERMLRDELGVEPSAETMQLLEDLLSSGEPRPGAVSLDPSSGQDRVTEAFGAWLSTTPPARPPFVARKAALSRLEQDLRQALSGSGRTIFILGEAGQGKTALLGEFCRRALAANPHLIAAFGTCDAYAGLGDPYLPFRQIAENLAGGVGTLLSAGFVTEEQARRIWDGAPAALEALNRHAPEIVTVALPMGEMASRASPEVRRSLQRHASARPSLSLDQAIVFEQFARFLMGVSTRSPLLLIIDDLQWTDEASLGLLMHLGRSLVGRRILLIGAYRPGDIAEGRRGRRHPLEAVVNELRRRHGDILLDLQETEEQEGREFIDAFLDTEANAFSQSFRDALFRHTGGHPLFTIELLRAMQERGDLSKDEAGRWVEGQSVRWHLIPARVDAVIQERVDRLPEDFRRILDIASVEGETFFAQIVAKVAGISERDAVQTIQRRLAREHRIVRAHLEGEGTDFPIARYRFSHHLIQRHLYQALAPEERRVLHNAIGEALEEGLAGVEPDPVVLAHHFHVAGVKDKAIANHVRAAERARQRYAYRESIEHYTLALSLCSAKDPRRSDILVDRVAMLDLVGDRQAQAKDIEDLRSAASEPERPDLMCEVMLIEADYLAKVDPARVRVIATKAADMARGLGDVRREARGHRIAGITSQAIDDDHASRESLLRAVELSRQGERSDLLASTLHALALSEARLGNLERGLELAEEAVEVCRFLGDRRQEAIALRRKSIILHDLDRLPEAAPIAQEALRISRELGDRNEEMLALNIVGIQTAHLGQYGDARTLLQESAHLAQVTGSEPGLAQAAYTVSAYGYASLGEHQGAAEYVDDLLRQVDRESSVWLLANLRWARDLSLFILGQFREQLKELEDLVAVLTRLDDPHLCEVLSVTAQVHLEAGEIAEAQAIGQKALSVAHRDKPFDLVPALLALAAIEAERPHRRLKLPFPRNLAQALELTKRPGAPLFRRMDALTLRARLLLVQGDHVSAFRTTGECIAVYERTPYCYFPQSHLFWHSRAARAIGRAQEADIFLSRAYERVRLVAEKTTNPPYRKSWLEGLRLNREILSEAVARGIGPDLRETMLVPVGC